MKPATVYLIGAGPGDPALITVRGQQLLAIADVIVYDRLIHRRLLDSVRARAEQINVGAAAPQPVEQEAINILLADKAREGKTVARLKWGDPFVFGSGGKEALFLHEQGIPYEVVPGVPPTIAVPAFAGIPVTYPGAGDALVLIRGHEAETSVPPDVDWRHVAPLRGTIVSYASGPQLEAIIDALLKHGRDPEEPTALVIGGTLPHQRTIEGTLRQVQAVVHDTQRRGTAVLIIGRVAALRTHLRWFDTRPLFGKRVVVTRAREQAATFVSLLLELGAEPVEAPTIRIAPPEDTTPLDEACAVAATFDWIVFTSANGVDAFMERLLAGPGDARSLGGVRLCAVGPATAARLADYQLKVDLVPPEHHSDAVADVLQEHVRGARVLLPRANLARASLPRALRDAGADVVNVVAYRTVPAAPPGDVDVCKMLLDQEIDAVTFTSASAVRNFVTLLGAESAADLLRTTVVAAIGPVTAEAARQVGISTTVMPTTHTVPALVDAIADYFTKIRLEAGG